MASAVRTNPTSWPGAAEQRQRLTLLVWVSWMWTFCSAFIYINCVKTVWIMLHSLKLSPEGVFKRGFSLRRSSNGSDSLSGKAFSLFCSGYSRCCSCWSVSLFTLTSRLTAGQQQHSTVLTWTLLAGRCHVASSPLLRNYQWADATWIWPVSLHRLKCILGIACAWRQCDNDAGLQFMRRSLGRLAGPRGLRAHLGYSHELLSLSMNKIDG